MRTLSAPLIIFSLTTLTGAHAEHTPTTVFERPLGTNTKIIWTINTSAAHRFKREIRTKKWHKLRIYLTARVMRHSKALASYTNSTPLDISPKGQWLIAHGGQDEFRVVALTKVIKQQPNSAKPIAPPTPCVFVRTPGLFGYTTKWTSAHTFTFYGDNCRTEHFNHYRVDAKTAKTTRLKTQWKDNHKQRLSTGAFITWQSPKHVRGALNAQSTYRCLYTSTKKTTHIIPFCDSPQIALSPTKAWFILGGQKHEGTEHIDVIHIKGLEHHFTKGKNTSTHKVKTLNILGHIYRAGKPSGHVVGWTGDHTLKAVHSAQAGDSGHTLINVKTNKRVVKKTYRNR